MNKRIQELAEQAGSTHKPSLGVYQFYGFELDRFAELIVRECAEWVNDNLGLVDEESKADLLKHFGVEE